MNDLLTIHFKTRSGFRDWLMQHHDSSNGIWMVYHKKHTNKENISYEEALEEALCFGWIDSLVKKIDEEKYVRKFTPRTNVGNWSERNRLIALKLIQEGRMTEAGLKKLRDFAEKGTGIRDSGNLPKSVTGDGGEKIGNKTKEITVPDFVLEAFRQHEPALFNFNRLAPSHQRRYILWITAAKREETLLKRIEESIQLLQKGQKLGLK